MARVKNSEAPPGTAERPRVGADLWALVACLALVALNFLLAPQEVRLLTILAGLALSVFLAAALKFPIAATPLFLGTLSMATLRSSADFPTFTLMAPVFCGIIAYSGRRWLTIACVAFLAAWGTLDPASHSIVDSVTNSDPVAVAIWAAFLTVAAALGWFLGLKDRQRRGLVAEWREELKAKQAELADELHDNVASSLTSLVMRAEALALQVDMGRRHNAADPTPRPDDEELFHSLEFIADEGRAAMTQLRDLLGALKTTEWQRPGSPALHPGEAIEQAITLLKNHGFRVQFRGISADGHAATISSREFAALLPDGDQQRMLIQRALFEGATNILKYAEPESLVEFAVASRPKKVRFHMRNQCRDDGEGASIKRASEGMSSGMGLESLSRWARRTKGTVRGHIVETQAGPAWSLDVNVRR